MQVDSQYKDKPLFGKKPTLNRNRIEELGDRLSKLALQQVQKRLITESRWLDDLAQYRGDYDNDTLQAIEANNGSQTYVNITRKKALTAESRLLEMALPTNDKNFSISPTPVPALLGVDTAGLSEDEIMTLARKKASAMEAEIDDQLTECGFHEVLRKAVHEACVFGNGILKAPVLYETKERIYEPLSESVFELAFDEKLLPGVEFVSVFDFFPDMSAREFEDCGFYFERKYLSKERLRELKELPGYDARAINEVLQKAPDANSSHDGQVNQALQTLSGQMDLNKGLYPVWEYNGSLSNAELQACGCETEIEGEDEALAATVVLVGNTVIKAALHPLEQGGCVYHLITYEKDDAGLFDFGVPYLLRNEQRTVNSAARKMHDNATLSSSPQIIVNTEIVAPYFTNDYSFSPGKLWELKDKNRSVRDAFASFDVPSNQAELLNILQFTMQNADEVTGIPMLQQGEKGTAPDTATGMSMLMNNSNVWLRRILKSVDDAVEGVVTCFYDWNMQNNPKPEIKGDFNIKAKGSATLLVRETQIQAMQNLAQISQLPHFADLTKWAAFYRKMVQGMQLPADDLVKTDKELEAEQQQPDPMQQQQQQLLEAQLEKLKVEIEKIKAETTVKNVEGLFSAVNTAEQVAVNPLISPIADEVYKSAGGQDYSGFPIIGGDLPAPPNQSHFSENTHPQWPANPDVGMMAGIDKTQV